VRPETANPETWTVPLQAGAITALAYVAAVPAHAASPVLILAHGAGADQRSPFMVQTAQALSDRGVTTVTFNFPYTEQRRKLPDRRPVLESCYRAMVDEAGRQSATVGRPVFIGGKSMGGRIATQIAAADAALPVAGLVALGYPLHPPGKPGQRRDAHLPDIHKPALIVQGSRDAFGTPAEFADVLARMTPAPTLHVIEGGDHSFKVARSGTAGQQAIFTGIIDVVAAWLGAIASSELDTKTQRREHR
jgi:predicted alpha/beta-hydrolase family hydrolase